MKHHLNNHHLSSGEDAGILKWLKHAEERAENKDAAENKNNYLIIDHANMQQPGYWDFLQDLKSGEIFYKGKFYHVDPGRDKIVFIGNVDTSPGRYAHPFLQSLPKVSFDSYTETYLKEHVILPQLDTLQLSEVTKNTLASHFVMAYTLAKQKLPYEIITIRDMESLLEHFCFEFNNVVDDVSARGFLACREVFAGLFKDGRSKEEYLHQLESAFNPYTVSPKIGRYLDIAFHQLPEPSMDEDYILPKSQQFIWHHINQYISSGFNDSGSSLRPILTEGPSGIGKTEMMLVALKNNGYVHGDVYEEKEKKHETKPAHIYFHITMGTDNVSEVIAKAKELSKTMSDPMETVSVALVIDELNLLKPKDEILLKSLMEEKPSKLLILASQNSQAELGRKQVSSSVLNHFDRVYLQAYSREDLIEMCYSSRKFSRADDPRAEKFVDKFLLKYQKDSAHVNTRTFFGELKNLPKVAIKTFQTENNDKVVVAEPALSIHVKNLSQDRQ